MVDRGWELVEYDWDPSTGVGTFLYERIRVDTEEVQQKTTYKEQKTWHVPGSKMKF